MHDHETPRRDAASWEDAWSASYGLGPDGTGAGGSAAPRRRWGGAGRTRRLLSGTAAVVLLAAPVSIAATTGGAETAGNDRGEAVQIEIRNRSNAETGLVSRSDDYSLRLSNNKVGGGGGAVYGCRAPQQPPEQDLACLYADNLNQGYAFLFRARGQNTAGHIDVAATSNPPFTTDAEGRVDNLNADRVDSQSIVTDTVTRDLGPVPAGQCRPTSIGAGIDVDQDAVTVTPRPPFPSTQLSVSTRDSPIDNAFQIILCNPGNATVNPPEAEYTYAIIDN